MTPRVTALPAAAADDADLVVQIAALVNAAYAIGDAGLAARRALSDRRAA
jgi:cell division septation protein DedD